MSKLAILILSGVACALPATPAFAADKPNPAVKTAAAKSAAVPNAWPPETMAGKITIVKPDQKLLVVVSPDGVPYDVVVTGATRIRSGNQSVTLKGLEQYQNKNVTIKFVPERRGDVAESIRIG
jgi:hypothetical protein